MYVTVVHRTLQRKTKPMLEFLCTFTLHEVIEKTALE